ncbi:MAG: hypothetical protein K2Y56_13565 [Methylobacterium sp.]|uniref:hypothetical protein n=1 Tax=Methylobacterium sp. TaxID=409 RepID=UPI0025D64D00|nr:hypothetical protein [Methylobacterium sp.]MBX9932548.1 hypothetical protein [Methylobacterium sp.]
MPTPITINVKNMSSTPQSFFFFQAPAIYSGGTNVYTNSLYTQTLLPYSTSGAVLTFSLILQFLAGVQQQVSPPVVGQPSGQLAASQPIGLTPAAGGTPTNNTTTMLLPSLGLTVPVSTQGPQAGSFRIITPPYNPVLQSYNAGSAIQTVSGGVTLSNFVTATPNSNLDCQPVLQFYVATGTYTPGTVMNFTSSSATAALCDATPGYTTFNVAYNADGTWSVTPFALFSLSDADDWSGIVPGPNAEVRNEAGTATISTGSAANFLSPVTVTNLSNPNAIQVYGEYPVGPTGGPYRGLMCTSNAAGTAIFS